TEGESFQRHEFAEPAQILERERSGPLADFAAEREKQGDRDAVSENEEGCARRSHQRSARDTEKNVAHVHDARITEHPIEPLLRDSHEPDIDDVTEQQVEEE